MPVLIKHPLPEMLAQRIYGLALGYEDLNDHEQLRHDSLLAVLSGKREVEEPLAGKSMKLFKIGALVRISVRRIVFLMSSAYPWKEIYAAAYHALRC